MHRAIPILALLLIALGALGLVAVGCGATAYPFNTSRDGGMMNGGGMMSAPNGGASGMMGNGGMMGNSNPAANVNATPVPSNQPIDREVNITARNFQFEPSRVVVKRGETVKFTLTNEDAAAHNFVSRDANIAYTYLPANTTASALWVAPNQAATFTALCNFHAGMQVQIGVE